MRTRLNVVGVEGVSSGGSFSGEVDEVVVLRGFECEAERQRGGCPTTCVREESVEMMEELAGGKGFPLSLFTLRCDDHPR